MPELPEVETARLGIIPHVLNHKIIDVLIREPRLRWPVSPRLAPGLRQQVIRTIERRAKYLLFGTDNGHLILHLGMSGSLRILPANTSPQKHDHIDLIFDNGVCLRYRDPRRFGCALWTSRAPAKHRLLRDLGPEPMGIDFNGDYLFRTSRGRSTSIKSYLMDSKVVSGVGNIYASESLFRSGIHPARRAGRISLQRYRKLAEEVRSTLQEALQQGGTTLKDFTNEQGEPGYFVRELRVYDREGAPCLACGRPIRRKILAQRATYFCSYCQN